ncbi:MAG: type II secretion system protein [Burkholderiaceae bacterium]|nr:type II secretion system protein [Burkholderiaceae bacterium]
MTVHRKGFTLIEIVIALAILSILVAMAAPVIKLQVQRAKEAELRHALREIRTALDAYKHASDTGRIEKKADASGYPPDLETLEGVKDIKDPKSRSIRLLRRIPRDPMNPDSALAPAQTWTLRSYASPPEAPAPGEDVFDVASQSPGVGLNGVPYKDW